ncbi:leucine-rich repeat-containing protein 20 isoform X2 [Sitodiplosis mosellana]|uniref:leucine-rich repeat-containing protein 20 isoform X2 n=1 Tax=Sitodiplosis mosellana TaxID=263140 RepID=UPI0024443BC0|nr:leucine-rich repeat-containing protein 20 isoform X2 [Sitodiplosis mosellana]
MPPAASNFGQDITNTTHDGSNDLNRNQLQNIERMGGTLLIPHLSECQLVQVPDAVYHLMRNTELKTCDLSSNVIKKIPPKFAMKFSLITDLNLSLNQLNKLPDELADLTQLLRLDISHNLFLSLPKVVFKMPKLRQLKANNNAIIDVENDEIIASDSLELVDLRKNPLTPQCLDRLRNARVSFHIELPERIKEDWEDLDV